MSLSMNNQFSRIEALITKENLEKIQSKHVLVVGLGGVGGYALEALVRSGMSHLTICDNDKVDITNLNRQIIATHSSIDKQKTEEFKKRIKDINPDCLVKSVDKFIMSEDIHLLFEDHIDYVVDCIDTLTTKVALWKYCTDNNIPVITSMGTAKKLDPSKLTITTLAKTSDDPMAKACRSIARKNNVTLDIPVVFSNEKPLNNDEELASMIFVPASAGLMCAYYVINDIIHSENDVK